MTTLEIEDVLSSIRRLVSEEEPKQPAESDSADRLVLTPAFRVADDPVENVVEKAEGADLAVEEDVAENGQPSLGEAELSDTSEVTASDAEQREPLILVGAIPKTQLVATEPAELFAQLETAVDQVDEEWEPDGSEPEAGEMPEQHIFASYRSHEDEPDVAPSETGSSDGVMVEPDPTEEGVDSDQGHVLHPDIVEDAIDEAHAAAVAGVAAATISTDRTAASEGDLGDQLLDEDSLRELVAEIVREELQGTLGERITRNVRRMVRREIQRALALKEFE